RDMLPGTVSERFFATMKQKILLLEPHRDALIALAARAIDPRARAGVLGDAAEIVRSKVSGVFALVVLNASDAPPADARRALVRALYAAHLALVLLWIQDREPERPTTARALDWLGQLLDRFGPMIGAALELPMAKGLDRVLQGLVSTSRLAAHDERARTILAR